MAGDAHPDQLHVEREGFFGAAKIVAGLTMAIGSVGPAIAEGRAVEAALRSLAQQPDEANTITRTLFVGLAMIESTAIYCFVVAMIILFVKPFWSELVQLQK